MNIQEKFAKKFEIKSNTTQAINSKRIQRESIVASSSNRMNVNNLANNLSINTVEGYSVGYSVGVDAIGRSQFVQPSFGSSSGSFINNPSHPFEFLDPLEKAKLIKEFLIERGVTKLNEETAKALFLVSCVLKDQVLPPVKQAKKKLII